MRSLKIGIIGTRGIPNHYGGFEQFAEQLSAGLVKRGHDVAVYNSSHHPYREKEWQGVKIIHCPDLEHKLGTAGQFYYDLNCINDARKRNFNILLHLGYTSDSVWYWRWPKQSVNIVNMDGLEWKRTKYNTLTQRFLQWAESLAARHAAILVADSPAIQEHLSKTYGKNAHYIPYGAEIFDEPDESVPEKYKLLPQQYFLLVARFEPENNIETILRGYLATNHPYPMVVIGNNSTRYGKYITTHYCHPSIKFLDANYNQLALNNLRYYCALYFHGHSVGGTNPSLLEAMACGCRIAAHDNRFNRAVLEEGGEYFQDHSQVVMIIQEAQSTRAIEKRKQISLDKIKRVYNQEKITAAYEDLLLKATAEQSSPRILHQTV